MADIYARLKTTPNGPGPQHKKEGINEFEFTEGKGGKLNVRDVDVKAELELIKQQQQQILQRLNEPIETELTGSLTERDTLKVSEYKEAETVAYQRYGVIGGGGTTEVLADLPGYDCILQSLSLGTNAPNITMMIDFYKFDGSIDGRLMVAAHDGSALYTPGPNIVQNNSSGENDFWKVQKFDTTNNRYVLTMKREIRAYNGFRIRTANWEDGDKMAAVNIVVAKRKRV